MTATRRCTLHMCLLLLAGGGCAWSADQQHSLTANLASGWVNNPALVRGGAPDDLLAVLTLSGRLAARRERDTLSLTPRFTATRYEGGRSLDTNTGSLELAYGRSGERGSWNLSAQGLVDSTLTSELGQSGVSDVNRRHEVLTAGGGYEWNHSERAAWRASGAWTSHHYADAAGTGLNDYRHVAASLGPTWSLRETTQASLVLGAERTLPRKGSDQSAFSASLRLAGSWNELAAWTVQAGGTRADAPGGKSNGALVALSVSSGGERLRFGADLRRDISPIGYGLLARKDRAGITLNASVTQASSLNLNVGYIRSAALRRAQLTLFEGAQYLQLGGEWRQRLSDRLDLTVSYSHVRAQGGRLPDWAMSNQARIGITWQSRRL